MNNFSVNKKLELMQQIRSRYHRDRSDLFQREKLLYGHSYENSYPDDETPELSTFRLRLLVAVAVFALLVLADRTGSSILGLDARKCFQAISADYESSIAAWTDAASNAITVDRNDTEKDG